MFWIIQTGDTAMIVLAMIIGLGIGHGVAYSVTALFFTSVFPVELRYTGSAVTYQVSAAVLSGPVPLVMTALVSAAGGSLWYGAGFLMLVCCAGLLGGLLLHPMAERDMELAESRGRV
ncbi:hypothetical protein [Tsukamurella sp. PLM1]|uniref:hypothetical protein n=1 Tax=Tsukamurella sp. PLM1 TaxID=2929795 RepID=UPI0020BDCC26|nr:hypothetical protein [Tsukamurella sp. PLM1]